MKRQSTIGKRIRFHCLLLVCALGQQEVVRAEEVKVISTVEWVKNYLELKGDANFEEKTSTMTIRRLENNSTPSLPLQLLPTSVKRVVLQGRRIEDSDLQAVSTWPDVAAVEVSDGNTVTDKGIFYLSAMVQLKEITLGETDVGSAGINAFSRHKNIRHITVVNQNRISQLRCFSIEDMPALNSLAITGSKIVYFKIARVDHLTEIVVDSTLLEIVEIEGAAIKELDLRNTTVNKVILRNVPQLKDLDLSNTKVTPNTLSQIAIESPGLKIKVNKHR